MQIDPQDIVLFNQELDIRQVEVLLRDGMAMARQVAPCLDDDDFTGGDVAAAIIRAAVLRWAESGAGAVSSEQNTAGPFSHQVTFDTRSTRRSLFFPSEITQLQALCRANGAFAADTIPASRSGCLSGNQSRCRYLFGSLSSPCQECGETLRPGWEEFSL